MRIDWLQPLLGQTPPFTTVYIDITGVGETAGRETANRWRGLRRDLERSGAPASTIDLVEEAVKSPPTRSGAGGRLLIATADGVHVDRELIHAPSPSQAVYDQDPALLPAAICADETVDYLVATIDRMGADFTRSVHDPAIPERTTSIEGDQDEITRTKAPPLLQRKVDHRAQDSWERNAVVVAAELDRIVQTDPPEIIIITGDVRATKLVCEAIGPPTAELVVEVPGGSRSSGVNEDALSDQLQEALGAFRERRRGQILGAYRQGLGRGSGAVSSLDNVIKVLQRGQVSEVIILESALTQESIADRQVWVGPEPLQLTLNDSELDDLGVTDGRRQMQALIAVVRAALAQDAGITFVPEDDADIADQVGAILRWDDEGTPHESAPSLSSDPERMRTML